MAVVEKDQTIQRPTRKPLGEPDISESPSATPQPAAPAHQSLSRADRPHRTPVGQGDRLKFSQRPGYYRRLVNDKEDRIQRFLDAGYEFVYGDETGGPQQSGDPSKMSSRISKQVGGGVTAYLMELPIDYRKEDVGRKARYVDQVEETMRKNVVSEPGRYGKAASSGEVEEKNPV